MPRLTPAQSSAIRYLLGLPGAAKPARTTLGSLNRAGLTAGTDDRRRVHPAYRAALCDTAGMTAVEEAMVQATLELWRRWDVEHAAADQEASHCRRLVDSLPADLRHYAVTNLHRGARAQSLADLAEAVTNAAANLDRYATSTRAEAVRLTERAERYEADAATLRDLAAAALATPRPTTGA